MRYLIGVLAVMRKQKGFFVAPGFYTNLAQRLVGQTKPEGAGVPPSHTEGGAEVFCCLIWFSSPDHLWKLLSQDIS